MFVDVGVGARAADPPEQFIDVGIREGLEGVVVLARLGVPDGGHPEFHQAGRRAERGLFVRGAHEPPQPGHGLRAGLPEQSGAFVEDVGVPFLEVFGGVALDVFEGRLGLACGGLEFDPACDERECFVVRRLRRMADHGTTSGAAGAGNDRRDGRRYDTVDICQFKSGATTVYITSGKRDVMAAV
ncbi:MAG: hypothetical protein JNK93_21165 [Planctomycetia bacterium]|nr:hypothetical protein [Planctomycetia bacterium]